MNFFFNVLHFYTALPRLPPFSKVKNPAAGKKMLLPTHPQLPTFTPTPIVSFNPNARVQSRVKWKITEQQRASKRTLVCYRCCSFVLFFPRSTLWSSTCQPPTLAFLHQPPGSALSMNGSWMSGCLCLKHGKVLRNICCFEVSSSLVYLDCWNSTISHSCLWWYNCLDSF